MGDATHQGEDTEIHMRMNWQLWNYYHRCGHNPKFWQTLFKLLREDRITESDPGGAQLKFAMKASEAAEEDLTDFFDLWGFFIPGEDTIEQYGTWKYKVTEEMIQEAKTFMKNSRNPNMLSSILKTVRQEIPDLTRNLRTPDITLSLKEK